jgi:hypothetical protein
MNGHDFPQKPAHTLLTRHGVAANWLLHLAAARACREGNTAAAASVIEIADAAEREWLQARLGDRRVKAPSAERVGAVEVRLANLTFGRWPCTSFELLSLRE